MKAEDLKAERIKKGLTQLQLAMRAGCSQNTIAIAERGGRLSGPMAERLSAVLVLGDAAPPPERWKPLSGNQESPVAIARLAVGLSQAHLAVRAGLSLCTVRNAEVGQGTTKSLAAIAKVLGVEVHSLRKQPRLRAAGGDK